MSLKITDSNFEDFLAKIKTLNVKTGSKSKPSPPGPKCEICGLPGVPALLVRAGREARPTEERSFSA